MDIASFRKARGLTQEQAAAELGLGSKSSLSKIETGFAPIGLKLALEIERWSGGELRALGLVTNNEEAELLRLALDRAAGAATSATPEAA